MSDTASNRVIVLGLILFGLLSHACKQPSESNLPGFEIHPAFRLERVATEPLIFDPVDMEFDEKGRAFVLEMPGYPDGKDESRLVLLTDTDNDGIFDQRKVFAEDLNLASSFMHYRGGMLVAAPPELLWIKDTDGDDVADERKSIMTGFSNGNLQHNFNGLTYGLDNWIYAGNGGNDGEPYYLTNPENKLNLRNVDIRIKPEEEKLERVGRSSGGFEIAFDDWGHMFQTHNVYHISHLVFEGRYIAELPIRPSHTLEKIPDHEEKGLSRIYPIGEQESRVNHPEQSGYFSGSCGITFYGGEAFTQGFNDAVFVADVVLNLIHMDVIKPNNASFNASRKDKKVEFLASSDRAFRPVNMAVGPDGALYVLDMHRDVIEHPEWIPDEMEANMDLAAGKDIGRIYRISPKGSRSNPFSALDRQDIAKLVEALTNQNQWVRMTAQRLLVEEGNENAIALLEQLIQQSGEPLARLHAMWTLEGMNALKSEHLLKILNDQVAGVRENALKVAEANINEHEDILRRVLEMVDDTNARVRMQVALCLSSVDTETYEKYAYDIRAALVRLINTNEPDTWTSLAVASAGKRQAVDLISELIGKEKASLVATTLARWVGKDCESSEIFAMLKPLTFSKIDPAEKASLIEALADGMNQSNRPKPLYRELGTILQEIESEGHLAVIRAAASFRKAVGFPASAEMGKLLTQAKTDVLDAEKTLENREEHLAVLALAPLAEKEQTLYQLLDNRQPLALQQQALQQLWDANEASVAQKLLDIWPTLGPESRKQASNILIYRSYNHDLLLTALETGKIKAGELNLDLERRRTLLWSDDDDIKRRAAALFSDAGVVTRKEALANMQAALSLTGDVDKGSEIYQAQCSSCHLFGDMGQQVGPVLTEISRKSRESLLHDIIDPNAAVDTKYLNHTVKTKDGSIYAGIVENETDTELTLRMMGGQEVQLSKADISELSSPGISLMPEGLESAMSPEDMADLLAFLQQMPQ